jgi:lysophospholipase L1-like esterase
MSNKWIFYITEVLWCQLGSSQVKLPVYADSLFSTYYLQRVSLFELMPIQREDIVFAGNSITDGSEWSELFKDLRIKNRGISGDVTFGILHRWKQIVHAKPMKVFLMIGTNDLARGAGTDSVVKNILLAADYLKQESPATELFIQSILPVTDYYKKFGGHTSKGQQIKEVNTRLKDAAPLHQYTFVDLYTPFTGADGKMDPKYSNDGLHLLGEGYMLWKHLVYPFIYNVAEKPALIPLPQQLNWTDQRFPLYRAKTIVVTDSRLQKEANHLQDYIRLFGVHTEVKMNAVSDEPHVTLVLLDQSVVKNKKEGYTLSVNANQIKITASALHGIFNGIQTMKQLLRDGVLVDGCEIIDWPAFAIRGYMIDVGRNYMSVDLLKQQIDVMAANKLNVFHFHPTEDIAWRFEVKSFPQLTDARHMLRNKGKYYTVEEIKDLIAYCIERYITLIQEIDMP